MPRSAQKGLGVQKCFQARFAVTENKESSSRRSPRKRSAHGELGAENGFQKQDLQIEFIKEAAPGDHPESAQERPGADTKSSSRRSPRKCPGELRRGWEFKMAPRNKICSDSVYGKQVQEITQKVSRSVQERLGIQKNFQKQDLQTQLIQKAPPGDHPESAQECLREAGS